MRVRENGEDASEDTALGSSGGGEAEGLALESDGIMRGTRSTCQVGTSNTSRAGAGAAVDVVWVDPPNGTLAVPSEEGDGSSEAQCARNGVDGKQAGPAAEGDVADVQLSRPSDVGHVTPIPPAFFEGYITTSRPYPTGVEQRNTADVERETSVILPRVRRVCKLGSDGRPIIVNPSTSGGSRIEELTDDRFEKRHYSSEIAERKHKKFGQHSTVFELQMERRRLLEEEKARKEREKRGLVEPEPDVVAKKWTLPFSFFPVGAAGPAVELSELQEAAICITDEIPLVAFGQPVPPASLHPQEFSLPGGAFQLKAGGRMPKGRRKAAVSPSAAPVVKRLRRDVIAPERFSYDDRLKDHSNADDEDHVG